MSIVPPLYGGAPGVSVQAPPAPIVAVPTTSVPSRMSTSRPAVAPDTVPLSAGLEVTPSLFDAPVSSDSSLRRYLRAGLETLALRLEEAGPDRCRLTLGSWSWPSLAAAVARYDADIEVVGPVELTEAFARLADRFTRAAAHRVQ